MKIFYILNISICFILISCNNQNKNSNANHINSQKIEFNTDKNINFCGKINDFDANLALDNGMSVTFIDSSFFFNHFDTSAYKQLSYTRWLGKFKFAGEINIIIKGKSYKINQFIVQNCANIGADGLDCIVGYDILRNHILKIDFPNHLLELCDSYTDSGYNVIPLLPTPDSSSCRKYIEASVYSSNHKNYKKGKFLFDLGCGGRSVAFVRQSFFKPLQNDCTLIDTLERQRLIFAKKIISLWHIDSIVIPQKFSSTGLIISTESFGRPTNSTLNDDPFVSVENEDGYLGWGVFKDHCIILDLKNNLLLVKKESQNE